jgi:hypothetical protein
MGKASVKSVILSSCCSQIITSRLKPDILCFPQFHRNSAELTAVMESIKHWMVFLTISWCLLVIVSCKYAIKLGFGFELKLILGLIFIAPNG